MIWIFKIFLFIFFFTCNFGDDVVTAAKEAVKKRGSFKATEDERKAAATPENIPAEEMCQQLLDKNTILEQTKKEAQKYLNGTIKSQFNVDEMGKIVNIHGKMPEKIQLENIKREGFKVLENELKTLKKEKKNQMDAELAKLKEKNDKQIKGLKENTNYKDRVTSIMDEFELKKKKLNEAYQLLIDELPNAKEIETKKKIYDEYANFVKEMSPKMENEVKTIKMENKINYGKAIGLMEELNAEYKQKNKKKSSVFDFIIKKCRKIFKTKRQKEKSEKLKKKALQAVFNEFIHEIDRQQGWNDEVKLEKLTRKMSQEERSLKNQSGIQLWKLFKAGLVLSTLPKRRRRSKRDLSGIEGAGPVKLEHLFGNEWSKIHMHGLGFGEVKSPTGKGSLIKDKTKFMEIWNKANMLNQPNPKDEKAPWEVGHDEEKEGNMEDLWKGSRMSMPHIIGREAESDTDTDTDSSSFFSSKRSDASVGSSFSSLSSKSSSSLHLQNSNSLDSQFVGSSRFADIAELQDDVHTMIEEQQTTDQFIHEFNEAKVSDGKFSKKMLQKFGELQDLDKEMKEKRAAVKREEVKHEELFKEKGKELARELAEQLKPLNTERWEKVSEIVKEYRKELNKLEGVKKEKLVNLNKVEELYEYIDEKNGSKTLLPLATFLDKVDMEFTDKSHRAKQQMEWAEQDINRKLILLATFEGKLAQIAKLEEEFGKMKEEMGKIEKELDGGTKELYEKCQDELEEYEDARSEFESDSD